MFHIVYSRHYWNHDEPGQFTNTHTIMRNVPYDNLHKHSSALEGYKITADKQAEEYAEEKNISTENFFSSECYLIDDEEYFARMMNSSWNIEGDADTYANKPKGWSGEESNTSYCFKP